MRRVLLLGGADPSGGAGVTLDAAVVALHRVGPLPVIVAWTVQDRRAFVRCDPVPAATWRDAMQVVVTDGGVDAIKVGLIGDAANVAAIAAELARLHERCPHVPIVVDPVFGATAGGWSAARDVIAAYREHLVPLATVLTPNLPELDALCGGDAERALAAGAGAVLVKGGHADGPFAEDVLWQRGARATFRRARLPVGRVRGTGCALASSLAARLARGDELPLACERAGDWLAALLRALGPAPDDGLPRLLQLDQAPNIDAIAPA